MCFRRPRSSGLVGQVDRVGQVGLVGKPFPPDPPDLPDPPALLGLPRHLVTRVAPMIRIGGVRF